MKLEQVKNYLRVDTDAEDELILLMIDQAKAQIKAGVGVYNEEDPRARMLLLYIVQYNYDNRNVIADGQTQNALQHLPQMFHALMFQLQVEQMEDIDEQH